MCTLWLVEALSRAGQYEPAYLTKAIGMLEVRPFRIIPHPFRLLMLPATQDFLGYRGPTDLLGEEISKGGEA